MGITSMIKHKIHRSNPFINSLDHPQYPNSWQFSYKNCLLGNNPTTECYIKHTHTYHLLDSVPFDKSIRITRVNGVVPRGRHHKLTAAVHMHITQEHVNGTIMYTNYAYML